MSDTRISKQLSYVLRHRPDSIGIALDAAGWVAVEELLTALGRVGVAVTREQLERIVAGNDKHRFAFSDDGARIRASQGHSLSVELGYVAQEPPASLYHGTVRRFLDSIRRDGLLRGARHHVHLAADRATATVVGARRGEAVVLEVRASAMHGVGHRFLRSANGVWLAAAVPPEFLIFPDESPSAPQPGGAP